MSGKVIEAAPGPPKKKAPILTLPRELKDMIFNLLPKIDSTCLGLASKVLYHIHWEIHGKVDLMIREGDNQRGRQPLYRLLRAWNHWSGTCRRCHKVVTHGGGEDCLLLPHHHGVVWGYDGWNRHPDGYHWTVGPHVFDR